MTDKQEMPVLEENIAQKDLLHLLLVLEDNIVVTILEIHQVIVKQDTIVFKGHQHQHLRVNSMLMV